MEYLKNFKGLGFYTLICEARLREFYSVGHFRYHHSIYARS